MVKKDSANTAELDPIAHSRSPKHLHIILTEAIINVNYLFL